MLKYNGWGVLYFGWTFSFGLHFAPKFIATWLCFHSYVIDCSVVVVDVWGISSCIWPAVMHLTVSRQSFQLRVGCPWIGAALAYSFKLRYWAFRVQQGCVQDSKVGLCTYRWQRRSRSVPTGRTPTPISLADPSVGIMTSDLGRYWSCWNRTCEYRLTC